MSPRTARTATTAKEAYERYKAFLASNSLTQGSWHSTAGEGRSLACALGVIGDAVTSPKTCPARIMPRWLAQMVPWLFDEQSSADAFAWGERFYAELARLNGVVPFSVIHDWQANVVGPLAIKVATQRKRNVRVHEVLRDMQAKALAGEKFNADEWRPVLKAAFFDANANASYSAIAIADADADAYADAYAYANADAYADANAYAYAYADAYADANAYAYAYANANANANAYAAKESAIKRLADGLIECLARVPATEG